MEQASGKTVSSGCASAGSYFPLIDKAHLFFHKGVRRGGGLFGVIFVFMCGSEMIARFISVIVFGKAFSIDGSRRIALSYINKTETKHVANCQPRWCSVRERHSNSNSFSKAINFVAWAFHVVAEDLLSKCIAAPSSVVASSSRRASKLACPCLPIQYHC